jgi:hypothetical protein
MSPVVQTYTNWDSETARKVMGVLFDVDKLYEQTINAIHRVSNKFVIVEPFASASYGYSKNYGGNLIFPIKPNSTNFAVGESIYQYYDFAWLDGDIKAVSTLWGVPSAVTEFGVPVSSIPSPPPSEVNWVSQACQQFATRGMNWFYWALGPGPDGDYSLIRETDDATSPILTITLPQYNYGVLPPP